MNKITSKNISTGSFSSGDFHKNITIGEPNPVANVTVPGVLDNMIYLDSSYLVISEDEKINCYKIDDKEDEIKVYLKEHFITKFDGKKINIEDLPNRIKSEVVKGKIWST